MSRALVETEHDCRHAAAEATEAAAPEAAEATTAAPSRRIAGTPTHAGSSDGGFREELAPGVGRGKGDDEAHRTGLGDPGLHRATGIGLSDLAGSQSEIRVALGK